VFGDIDVNSLGVSRAEANALHQKAFLCRDSELLLCRANSVRSRPAEAMASS
jgi:hypothetical protein